MSAPAAKAAWQQPDLAASFAERRRALVPLLDLQEEVFTQVLNRHDRLIRRFLDLGCGAGAISELVLDCQPASAGVLVDFSEPMLEHAGSQLSAHAGRWQAVCGDLSEPTWVTVLPAGRCDAVVSGLALHHLSPDRKRALFAEVFALLEPGGIFVNMDYVAIAGPLMGLFDEQMRAGAVRAEHEHGGTRTAQEVDFEDNEDQPDTVHDQLRWLGDAGFQQAEVHFKWAEAAIYGGVKPAKGDV
jgi:tRNA (cmo5U34)-methyltransferase